MLARTLLGGMANRCFNCGALWILLSSLKAYAEQPDAFANALQETQALRLPTSQRCPQCNSGLFHGRSRTLQRVFTFCSVCQAVWLDLGAFQGLEGLRRIDLEDDLEHGLRTPEPVAPPKPQFPRVPPPIQHPPLEPPPVSPPVELPLERSYPDIPLETLPTPEPEPPLNAEPSPSASTVAELLSPTLPAPQDGFVAQMLRNLAEQMHRLADRFSSQKIPKAVFVPYVPASKSIPTEPAPLSEPPAPIIVESASVPEPLPVSESEPEPLPWVTTAPPTLEPEPVPESFPISESETTPTPQSEPEPMLDPEPPPVEEPIPAPEILPEPIAEPISEPEPVSAPVVSEEKSPLPVLLPEENVVVRKKLGMDRIAFWLPYVLAVLALAGNFFREDGFEFGWALVWMVFSAAVGYILTLVRKYPFKQHPIRWIVTLVVLILSLLTLLSPD